MAQVLKQCIIEVPDEVGRLAELTEKIKKAKINILALCGWVEGHTGRLMMVTEDHDQVYTAISLIVDQCEFREVVSVKLPNETGSLNRIAHQLADAGIHVKLVYATGGEADEATVILDTDNNIKAAEII